MRTFIISALFIVSGILGFCCQMLYANYFGSGKEMDIYFALFSIPAIITGATGTIFSSLFFPAFARIGDTSRLDEYIYTIKMHVSRIALIIAVIGFSVTYFTLTRIIDSDEPKYYDLAFILSILFWLNSYISIVAGFLASVQNYFKNFLVVSCSQLIVYFSIIFFVVAFHKSLGVSSIAVGLLTSSIIQLFINRYYGNIFHKSLSNVNIDALKLFSNICLIIISFMPFHAFASISYLWAGNLNDAGSVSFLGYSHSFCGFLSTAASMGIATVSFPDLARSLSSTNTDVSHKGYINFRNQLEVVVIFASFVAIFTSLFAQPIIEVLFMRGQFDMDAVNGLSFVLPIYLMNGVFIAMMNLTRNVYYSLNKQKLFAFFSSIVTLVFVFSSVLLSTKVNYIVIGIVEVLSMGLFVLISLCGINSFDRIFDLKYILKLIGQLVILFLIGFGVYLLYKTLLFNENMFISIIVCGLIYSLSVDAIFSTLIKSTIVLAINSKIVDLLKRN